MQAQSAQAQAPAAAKKAKRITWKQLTLQHAAAFGDKAFSRKELFASLEAEAFALFPRNGNWQNTAAQQLTALCKSGELIRAARGIYAMSQEAADAFAAAKAAEADKAKA